MAGSRGLTGGERDPSPEGNASAPIPSADPAEAAPIRRSRGRLRTGLRCVAAVCGVAALVVGGYVAHLAWTDNFHSVVDGAMYRSAQPSGPDIVRYAKAYGIKTIINLRGANVGKGWYDAEVAEARALDIDHVDFRMSARQELTQARAAELIDIMATARKPMLVHCNTGADRSGLAAALYVAAIGKLGEDAAEAQMSLRYGHIALSLNSAYAMDATWETLEPWLGFPDS